MSRISFGRNEIKLKIYNIFTGRVRVDSITQFMVKHSLIHYVLTVTFFKAMKDIDRSQYSHFADLTNIVLGISGRDAH